MNTENFQNNTIQVKSINVNNSNSYGPFPAASNTTSNTKDELSLPYLERNMEKISFIKYPIVSTRIHSLALATVHNGNVQNRQNNAVNFI
jgi:hypothetical protein